MTFIILNNSIACPVNEGKNGCWGKNKKIEDVRKTIGEGENTLVVGKVDKGMRSGENKKRKKKNWWVGW